MKVFLFLENSLGHFVDFCPKYQDPGVLNVTYSFQMACQPALHWAENGHCFLPVYRVDPKDKKLPSGENRTVVSTLLRYLQIYQ